MDGYTVRQIYTQRGIHTCIHTDKQTHNYAERQKYIQTHRHIYRDRRTDRWVETERQIYRQKDT